MLQISDYLFSKAAKNKIPLQGGFELSPVCNFSCKMCFLRKSPEQIKSEGKRLRSWEEWLSLGKQCRDAGMLYLLITGGEPFIYPDFRKLYEGLQKLGLIIIINSNGTMIDEETVEWLKTMAPSRINITLYGANPDTYERVCGRRDGYERAKRAISMLQEAGIPVVINASMVPENEEDLEAVLEFGKERGLNVRMTSYMFPPIRREAEKTDSRFTAEEAANVYMRRIKHLFKGEELKELLEKELKKLHINEEAEEETWGSNLEHMRCRAGRSNFWVSWDGTMAACGMLPFPIETNPFEEPFTDCWSRINEAVESAKVMEVCNACYKKEICHPCVAQLYAEIGNVHDKSPYLCEMTDRIIEAMVNEVQELNREE